MRCQISAFTTLWKNIKKEYKNNKFKITAPTWTEEFKLSDESYFVSYIQDYFQYIIKKIETHTDKSRLLIYANETEIIITFKKKSVYYLALSTPETMKFLGSTKNRITKDKNGKLVPLLEINEVKLLYCNFVSNNYHHD